MVFFSMLFLVFSVFAANPTNDCSVQAEQLKTCTNKHKGLWGKCENTCFLKKSSCLETHEGNSQETKRCQVEGRACSSNCAESYQASKICPSEWRSLNKCQSSLSAVVRPNNVFAVSVDKSVLGVDLICNRKSYRGKRVDMEFWFTNIDRKACSLLKFKPTGSVWKGTFDMDILYCQMKAGGSLASCSKKNPKIMKKQTRQAVEETRAPQKYLPKNILQISIKGGKVGGVDLSCEGKSSRGRKNGSNFEFTVSASEICKVKFKPSGITWVGKIQPGAMICELNSRNLASCEQM